jgi:hypothetical protein
MFKTERKGTGCPIENFGHDIYWVVIPVPILRDKLIVNNQPVLHVFGIKKFAIIFQSRCNYEAIPI